MKAVFKALDGLGWAFCEYSFTADRYLCRPQWLWTALGCGLSYRLGCWCYGKSTALGIRHGFLKRNPEYAQGNGLPQWTEA